ncbi:hypothetical protein C8R42DRAFT_94354 [Lentinula raphanica]|nr:hypothetical protein C8R42DRAFT_94354 [Lentinula raphanica]
MYLLLILAIYLGTFSLDTNTTTLVYQRRHRDATKLKRSKAVHRESLLESHIIENHRERDEQWEVLVIMAPLFALSEIAVLRTLTESPSNQRNSRVLFSFRRLLS